MSTNSHYSDLPDLAPLIHQAALDPHLSIETLYEVCDASRQFNFSGLCTDLTRLSKARKRLGSLGKTKLISVIAFTFGFIPTSHKKAEAEWAANQGAEELDLVPNFYALRQGEADEFASEIATICEIGLPVRVILDIAHLPEEQLSLAIDASIDAGASSLQSSNGFGPPATGSDISQLKQLIKGRCAIQAAGGLKSLNQAIELVEAGATTLGTSFGLKLMQDLRRVQK